MADIARTEKLRAVRFEWSDVELCAGEAMVLGRLLGESEREKGMEDVCRLIGVIWLGRLVVEPVH